MLSRTRSAALPTVIVLVVASMSISALPTASAHYCKASQPGLDPGTVCGQCTSGDHEHQYHSGTIYCKSKEYEYAMEIEY